MKTIFTLFFSLLILFSAAQQTGNIRSSNEFPRIGKENKFVYTPSKGAGLPARSRVSIVYYDMEYAMKIIPLHRKGDRYEFYFQAPASANVLLMAIVDDYKNVIDNNKDQGYIFYLNDGNRKLSSSAPVMAAILLEDFTSYVHKTKVPASILIRMHEKSYQLDSRLKKSPFYFNYLRLLYKERGKGVQPQLLDYANQMTNRDDETTQMRAVEIYALLEMDDRKGKIEEKILADYPNGALAKQKFWNSYYAVKEPAEGTMLAAMDEYKQRFKDSTAMSRDHFYMSLISFMANKKDWQGVLRYGARVTHKLRLAGTYNSIAWELSGGDISSKGADLDFARIISKQSIDIIEERLKQASPEDDTDDLKAAHTGYSDTYALILYKLGSFDSAFYYQHAISEKGPMGVEGMERYAVYAEKAKGAAFARAFIEPQLLNGADSPAMLRQLQAIYRQLNLPDADFAVMKERSAMLARKKTAEKIIARFGSQKASEFTLKDLQGQAVSLASLKDKVVVMDFWATWCGPCRASFPAMQELINKYRNDKDVVFLFIDTWEGKKPEEMRDNAARFINENKYEFQVLLDEKDKVVTDYKVEGIPAKFILDKRGKIVFMGDTADLSLAIEAAKVD